MQAVTCNATESLEEVIVLFVIIELKEQYDHLKLPHLLQSVNSSVVDSRLEVMSPDRWEDFIFGRPPLLGSHLSGSEWN